jgi:LDH2 family malate/lactate/ureidoglycolate dehydrogenase
MVLPRFVIPEDQQVIVPEAAMRGAVRSMFEAVGMPSSEAAECTDVLIVSDLRGNDSHGVSNMLRMYMENFIKAKAGLDAHRYGSNPQPKFQIVRDSPAGAVVDADGGMPCA